MKTKFEHVAKQKPGKVKKLAVLGSSIFAFLLLVAGAGGYYYMSSKAVPEGMRPLAPTASEAPKANYSGQVADRRADPAAQIVMPEDVKMPTEIDIQSPQVPNGLADPMGDKK